MSVSVSQIKLESGRAAKINPAPRQTPKHVTRKSSSLYTACSTLIVIALLFAGWKFRSSHLITAEYGVGYALGIAGGISMLVLLLYPLRKRSSLMKNWGKVRHWFRAHMMLGIAGPMLILFHANFSMGSTNSNVALISMLIVASSGLFGRYFYSRIHHGLYGHKASLAELADAIKNIREESQGISRLMPIVRDRLIAIEQDILAPGNTSVLQHLRLAFLGTEMFFRRLRLNRILKSELNMAARQNLLLQTHRARLESGARQYINRYLQGIRRVAQFQFFERLFSLWHVVHYPLFFLMIGAAIVHVLAVHMY